MANKATLAVVDDHSLFRECLVKLLKENKYLDVIFEASNGSELLEKLKFQKPQVIILDIEMPIINGKDATVAIKRLYPEIKIIILSMHDEEEYIFSLIEEGVNAFVNKDNSCNSLVNTINTVIEKGFCYNETVTNAMANKIKKTNKKIIGQQHLTPREIEVVKLICKQHTNSEIADILLIGQRTIEGYRQAILSKTGAKNTVGIVLYALENKLIDKPYKQQAF